MKTTVFKRDFMESLKLSYLYMGEGNCMLIYTEEPPEVMGADCLPPQTCDLLFWTGFGVHVKCRQFRAPPLVDIPSMPTVGPLVLACCCATFFLLPRPHQVSSPSESG